MSGAGSRFMSQSYLLPKPLIDVNGKTMISTVLANLNTNANYIFIVNKEHEKYGVTKHLKELVNDCRIVYTEGLTEGAACSALLAKDIINNSIPLFIINSDQYININFNTFFTTMENSEIDGSLITCTIENDKRWSYVKVNENGNKKGLIAAVAEKQPISDIATTGCYYFKHGKYFVQAAEEMIKDDNKRVGGEFYIAPVFNELLNKVIIPYHINTYDFNSLGTPELLQEYVLKK